MSDDLFDVEEQARIERVLANPRLTENERATLTKEYTKRVDAFRDRAKGIRHGGRESSSSSSQRYLRLRGLVTSWSCSGGTEAASRTRPHGRWFSVGSGVRSSSVASTRAPERRLKSRGGTSGAGASSTGSMPRHRGGHCRTSCRRTKRISPPARTGKTTDSSATSGGTSHASGDERKRVGDPLPFAERLIVFREVVISDRRMRQMPPNRALQRLSWIGRRPSEGLSELASVEQ